MWAYSTNSVIYRLKLAAVSSLPRADNDDRLYRLYELRLLGVHIIILSRSALNIGMRHRQEEFVSHYCWFVLQAYDTPSWPIIQGQAIHPFIGYRPVHARGGPTINVCLLRKSSTATTSVFNIYLAANVRNFAADAVIKVWAIVRRRWCHIEVIQEFCTVVWSVL